jgi:hypothetical protein
MPVRRGLAGGHAPPAGYGRGARASSGPRLMPAVSSDWSVPVSTRQVSRRDAPVPCERLERVAADRTVRGERLGRAGGDRTVAAEWGGPKGLPLFPPADAYTRSLSL